MGSFKVHSDLSVCCVHRDETGTEESVQVLTWKN